MSDLLDELEAFVSDRRKRTESATDREQLKRIEEKLDALQAEKEPAERDVRELAAELASRPEFRELVEQEEKWLEEQEEVEEQEGNEQGGKGEDEEKELDESERWPRHRLSEVEIGRLWAGEDEPDHVEYFAEDGSTKVRAGRKRGVPAFYEIEELAKPGEEEAEEE